MDMVIGFVIGAVIALGAAWFLYVQPLKKTADEAKEDRAGAVAKTAEGIGVVTALHEASFGPVHIPLDAVFNDLWSWAGLEEKGAP